MPFIEDFDGNDPPFIDAKIVGNLIDFEDRADPSYSE